MVFSEITLSPFLGNQKRPILAFEIRISCVGLKKKWFDQKFHFGDIIFLDTM